MEETESAQLTPKSNTPILLIAVTLLILGFGAYLYSAQTKNKELDVSEATSTPAATTVSASPVTTNAAISAEANQIIEVEGGSFYYKPNTINVKKGQPVQITLKSVDMMHDFVIDEFNVKSTIAKKGESTVVTFTPDKTGEFEYYCSVGSHRAQGMVGKLVVTD